MHVLKWIIVLAWHVAISILNSQFSYQNLRRRKGSVQENLKALGPHFLALRFNFVPNNFAMNLRFLTNFSFFESKDFMDSQMQWMKWKIDCVIYYRGSSDSVWLNGYIIASFTFLFVYISIILALTYFGFGSYLTLLLYIVSGIGLSPMSSLLLYRPELLDDKEW